jgi:hypothetical protein
MPRGFLYNLLNVPPLVFRFQFHPDMMQEKRSFTYKEVNSFGKWTAEKTEGAFGAIGKATAFYEDLKDFGPLLTASKPLESEDAQSRQISLEFTLDADLAARMTPDRPVDPSRTRNVQQDLAVLRSFMNPSWDAIDLIKMAAKKAGGKREVACFSRPPDCSLSYGGLSLTCVMTDLNIKTTAFYDNGDPRRCEVAVTLREQPWSLSTVVDFGKRLGLVSSAYGSVDYWRDAFQAVVPESVEDKLKEMAKVDDLFKG